MRIWSNLDKSLTKKKKTIYFIVISFLAGKFVLGSR